MYVDICHGSQSYLHFIDIKTYAVTPLNEECGLIEWVDNLKTLRDILLKLYKQKDIPIKVRSIFNAMMLAPFDEYVAQYNDIRVLLDEACSDDAKLPLFTKKLLGE